MITIGTVIKGSFSREKKIHEGHLSRRRAIIY